MGQVAEEHFHYIVDEVFRPFIATAVARLTYLHPRWSISHDAEVIDVSGIASADDLESARKDVAFALYRERILEIGQPLREKLYRTILE